MKCSVSWTRYKYLQNKHSKLTIRVNSKTTQVELRPIGIRNKYQIFIAKIHCFLFVSYRISYWTYFDLLKHDFSLPFHCCIFHISCAWDEGSIHIFFHFVWAEIDSLENHGKSIFQSLLRSAYLYLWNTSRINELFNWINAVDTLNKPKNAIYVYEAIMNSFEFILFIEE